MSFHRHSAAIRATAALFIMAAPCAVLAAAATDDELSEIVVTGRLEETLPQELSHYGSRVESISSEQVQRGGYNDISQALQALAPGMYIAPLSGAFDYVQLSFQGSRPTEVLWLVDGIRLNNRLYATTTPLDTIPAHLVERIEVLEGGESLFYGTQSIAGTVNIVTRQFADRPEGQVELGLDTNDGKHASGYFRTAVGGSRFVVFGSRDKATGFKPFSDDDYQPSSTDRKRGYDVDNFGLKYAYDFGDAVRTSFGYQHTKASLDYARPTTIYRASNDRNEDLLTGKIDITAGDNLQLFAKGYYHDWDAHYNETDNTDDGPEVVDDHEFWGFKDYGANLLGKYSPGGPLEYLAGWDYQHYSGEDQVFLIAPNSETVHAPFAQVRTSSGFSDSVRLSLGARYNKPNSGQSATVWTATSHWDISPNLFVRANLGTAFRLPSAYELFVIDPCCEQGNPNLKPERSKYLNASIGGTGGSGDVGFGWELVGFVRDVKDLISIVTVGGIDTLENTAGKSKVRGGELVLSGHAAAGLSGNLSFTVTDAKAKGSSQQQQQIPESLAKLALDYSPPGRPFFTGVTLSYTGDVFRNQSLHDVALDDDVVSRIQYGKYFVLDLNAGLRLGEQVHHRITLWLENALDRKYATAVAGATPDAGGNDYAYSFLGTPRTLHAAYTFQF